MDKIVVGHYYTHCDTIYFCKESLEDENPRLGCDYLMVLAPNENDPDGREDRTEIQISDRARGRTFHRIYVDEGIPWSRTMGVESRARFPKLLEEGLIDDRASCKRG